MGVPAFFRWLSRKYASIVVHCVEEKPRVVNGEQLPVDTSQPNPNDVEFDNLYLDMNGIIHPCCHPEDKPAPQNEDEMMVAIFECIDRLFTIVRPRKVLYMAIDGVAPRAKMNQQRSRRFRAIKESHEKREDIARIKEELYTKGALLPPEKEKGEHFDSNCITPGTDFMFRLAECLRYYIHERLNNDPGWAQVKVFLSDANVPGEGEHKIMDFIRRQRAQPDHNPNTHHCLCGADADLIMLGLATHEPHFTIIREEFKPNKPRACDICRQFGHDMKECTGLPKDKMGENDELEKQYGQEQEFIFLRLCVLREYLESELTMPNLPFKQDLERAIDDWVFMCFFVGNDFLPHLPSLEIREGAIDRLVNLYKKAVYKTGGYLTDSGLVNLERVQLVLSDLGEVEDEIFKKRREDELDFKRRSKERAKRARQQNSNVPSFMLGGQYKPQSIGGGSSVIQNPRQTAYQMRVDAMNDPRNAANQDAAANLRAMLVSDSESKEQTQKGSKRKSDEMNGGEDDEEDEPEDEVKLWEDGWKDRYYLSKFGVGPEDQEFRHSVANEYVLGLCWVLRYYYQGCASWKWYFPHHYAPFASDFVNIGDLNVDFEKNTIPFKPLEQLMGVFPAGSKKFLPTTWQELMTSPVSPIIDFYPEDFKIDLNGKKHAWQGVALLPFVDEKRLKKALECVYPDLTHVEIARNVRGGDRLFVSKHHSSHDFLESLYDTDDSSQTAELNPKLTQGVRGEVSRDGFVTRTGGSVESPLSHLRPIHGNTAICVSYQDPQYPADFIFPAKVLPGAKFPGRVLKPEDFDAMRRSQERGRGRGRGSYRPQLGFQPHSGYRDRDSFSTAPASRMIQGSIGSQRGAYGNVPPPQRGGYHGGPRGSYQGSNNYSQRGHHHDDRRSHHQHQQRGSYSNQYSSHNRSDGYSGRGGYGRDSGYGNNSSNYNNSRGGYDNNTRGYGNRGGYNSGYNNRGDGYGPSSNSGYGSRDSGYSSSGSGYGSQRGGYGVQSGGYGVSGSGRGGYDRSANVESYSTSSYSSQQRGDRRNHPQSGRPRPY